MKKGILTVLMVCLAVSASAVDVPKQGFGLQIGWAQPIIRLNDPSAAYPSDSLVNTVKLNGFKAGLVYDASYIAGFGSSMGINYTFGAYTGAWRSKSAISNYPRSRQIITYHEVEVFVDWQYKFEVAKETYLMLYTGPTIQCGLGFNMRIDQQTQNMITGEIMTVYGQRFNAYNVGDDDLDPTHKTAENSLKRLNITWGVGAGFQYQRYFLRGGYDFGLINPYKNADFLNGRHTRGRLDQWSIKIGMYFWYND